MQSILGPLVNALTWVLNWLHSAGLTWGLSIIGLTIIVRLILFPLTWKQYKSTQEMQAIQPQIKALQKKYKNDRGKLQEETMKLYQEHHVNPFASCLPLVLQLPIFISLYYAIRGEQDLADATFLGIPLGAPSVILLIVYVLTQIVSTELMLVTQSDKTQKMIMRAMPLIFVFVLRSFPAGLFVYWITTNLWTIGQQLIIRRTMPKPEELAARAKAKPKKRSRFMEAMAASQSEAMKQREAKMARKREAGEAVKRGDATKQSTGGGTRKAAPGGRKPPPGKVKRKQQGGQQRSARPQGGKTAAGRQESAGRQKPRPKPKPVDATTGPSGDDGATTSAGGPADE